VARGLDRDIIVLLEVDTCVLLGRIVDGAEEFALNAGIGGARDVLAIAPLAVSRASNGLSTAAAAAGGASISTTARGVTAATSSATGVAAPSTAGTAARGLERWDIRAVAPVGLASVGVVTCNG